MSTARRPGAPARRPGRAATIATGGTVGLLGLWAAVDSGIGAALILISLVLGATALYALVSGRRTWARLPGRASAARVLAGSVAVTLVGGALVGLNAPPGGADPDPAAGTAPAGAASSTPAGASPAGSSSQAGSSSAAAPSSTQARRPAPPSSSPAREPAPAATRTPAPRASAAPAPRPTPAPAAGTALAVLADLPVKGRAPKTGYDRERFGQAWLDVDRNGCDTRNDMLRRQLTDVVFANSVPCRVSSGTLADPYTGTVIGFVRGQGTSSAVQIDHVVALSDAWQKGAQRLGPGVRAAFANDPLNLQATDGPANARKGDGDAATWLPPNKAHRCAYVARQIGVKHKYDLWVTAAEGDAMRRVLAACPGQRVPAGAAAAVVPARGVQAPETMAAPRTSAPRTAAPAGSGEDVYYENCDAARAAGADPVYRGEPGYAPHLDGNSDGVGCE